MMKGIFPAIVILITSHLCWGQSPMKPLLDSVLEATRQTSMYATSVEWDSLAKQVHAKAENAQTVQDLKPALTMLLNGLRDHHGRYLDATNYSTLAVFTDYDHVRNKADTRPRDGATWQAVNDTSLKFTFQLIPPNTGYLRIVGIPPMVDIQKESEKIRNAVKELVKQKAKYWIVDLRYNGGGNMYPMMAGIAPIIGDGEVGKLVSGNNDTLFHWTIRNGNFTYNVPDVVLLPNQPKFKTLPKVAVLTSKWTVSSGEVVATAFKGRPNTRFFGEATGGYATNTGWDIINNKIIIVIATGMFCDRNGVVYDTNIPVDVEIPFEIVKDMKKDACVLEAMKWLKG